MLRDLKNKWDSYISKYNNITFKYYRLNKFENLWVYRAYFEYCIRNRPQVHIFRPPSALKQTTQCIAVDQSLHRVPKLGTLLNLYFIKSFLRFDS
jgi:hypothetical protein